jgi:hypothetical protein
MTSKRLKEIQAELEQAADKLGESDNPDARRAANSCYGAAYFLIPAVNALWFAEKAKAAAA